MIIRYLARAPGHDIILTKEDLCLPFKITPTQYHPFLTLGDYFDCIKSFVLGESRYSLLSILREVLSADISMNDIETVLIRSEKHGAFYHVASIEFITTKGSSKFAVCSFLSANENWFKNEYANLKELETLTSPLQVLPRFFIEGKTSARRGAQEETLYFLIGQWLEGFYEWHLHPGGNSLSCRVLIWDSDDGYRFASKNQSMQVYHNISFILTLCYDTITHRRVNLWQNSAGDFVVRPRDNSAQVMLTTVRDYSSIVDSEVPESHGLLMAMTFFFLETLTLIRLDRVEGIGDLIWCENWCIQPAIRGVVDALKEKIKQKQLPANTPSQLLMLLRSFSLQEIKRLLQYTTSSLAGIGPAEKDFLISKLEDHSRELYHVIQTFQI